MLNKSLKINTISQVHQSLGLDKPKHPLVSVIYAKNIKSVIGFQDVKIVNNLYQIALKQTDFGALIYGKNSYDYEEGTLIFTAPGQVSKLEGDYQINDKNLDDWTLVFHPDLIRKSSMTNKINQYSFFGYDVNEALHLSDDERKIIEEILDKIIREYSQNLDRHSQHLIIANIELLLDYCVRFYDRQFYTRTNLNSDFVS
ncbi:MAG: AraC family transcriptional regulator, partial [Bacteroidota bacterium]